MRKKEGKFIREGGKLKMEVGKVLKRVEDLFFFFFFFFFCFGLPKWEFSTGKKHFTTGKKNQEK